MKEKLTAFVLTALVFLSGCYVIAPWPTINVNGTNREWHASPAGDFVPSSLPDGYENPLESIANVAWYKHIWRFCLRNAKLIVPVAAVCWLAGWSGMYWMYRKSKYAFHQVVAGAQMLKEEVQIHIPKDKSNKILSEAQDKWVAELVRKAKSKLK
jgi:hypothetical protein